VNEFLVSYHGLSTDSFSGSVLFELKIHEVLWTE